MIDPTTHDQTAQDQTPKDHRRTTASGVCVACVATLLCLFQSIQGLARPLDDILAAGSIVIAVYRDHPPFSSDDTGPLIGIDVDLGRAIAARLGVAAEFMVNTAADSVDDDLRNVVWRGHLIGRKVADLMLQVPVDRRLAMRNDQVVIFGPYARQEQALAFDPEKVGGVDQLKLVSEKIGVEVDTLPDFFLSSAYGGQLRAQVVHFRSITLAGRALIAGELVAAMAPRTQLEAALRGHRDRFAIEPVVDLAGFGLSSWVIGAAVDLKSRDLKYRVEDVIAEFVDDGTLARMFMERGLTYQPP